jgi:hypothetical protein
MKKLTREMVSRERGRQAMIVTLKKVNPDFPDLSPGQPYCVIGIEADDYRILNDAGRPYLYPAELFEMRQGEEPADWVSEIGEAGERYAYPPELNEVGFFEEYFDGRPETVAQFWRVVNRHLALAA